MTAVWAGRQLFGQGDGCLGRATIVWEAAQPSTSRGETEAENQEEIRLAERSFWFSACFHHIVMFSKEYWFRTKKRVRFHIYANYFIQNVENAQKTQDMLTLSCLL